MQENKEYSNEELVKMIREGNEADRKQYLACLYSQNYGFIHNICQKYARGNVEDLHDYEQESYFALKLACERYDDSQGASFLSYAGKYIKWLIIRYRYNQGVIKFPVNFRQSIIKYQKIVKEYTTEHGTPPNDREIMSILEIDRKQLKKLKQYSDMLMIYSLDKTYIDHDEEYTLLDVVADPIDHYSEVNDDIDDELLRATIWAEVEALGDIDSKVIHYRYQDNKTLRETGAEMNLSPERVRQIQAHAIRHLRKNDKIKVYRDEYYSAFQGVGLSAYRRTGTSATERAAIKAYDEQIDKILREVEQTTKRIEKKYGITLDDGYRQMQIEKRKRELNL